MQHHIETVSKLPEPTQTWQASDVGLSNSEILQLKHRDLINREDRGKQVEANKWSTDPAAYDYIQDLLANRA